MYKLAFIGCGNMARAMIKGVLASGLYKPNEICATDKIEKAAISAAEEYRICAVNDNKSAAENSEIVVLAVKPRFYPEAAEEIAPCLKEGCLVVSIAAGYDLKKLEELFGSDRKIVRAMPNTPAMVGEGMSGICLNANVNSGEAKEIEALFSSFGRVEQVEEYMMDGVVALSGSSPAYVYMMIEAMADAGVKEGLPRDKAYIFAAQAVLGSAKMVLETGKHPGELKDMVTSPMGTTIEAVASLEKSGFRAALISAVEECADKNRRMA